MSSHIISQNTSSGKAIPISAAIPHRTVNHMMEHVLQLTRKLLALQKAGQGCDVTLHCKDGVLTAHSGTVVY